ncbi:MAG: flippase-like domain-containing protein, partial [Pyrinomonadaceae bacterium]|nr:flippase-like domain-containing protein [Sphingobacteriaceae bacterium]
MAKKKLWNALKLVLKLSVTGIALYWVAQKVDTVDFKEAFSRTKPGFFVLAFACYVVSQIVSSSRLNTFFKGIGLELPDMYNFKLYLLGMFYNQFLPGGVGGDGYKVYLLKKKYKISARKLISALFFDRLSGLWGLGVIICALVILIPQLGIPQWMPVLAAIAATSIYYFILSRYFPDIEKFFFIKHLKALIVQSFQVICVIFLLYAFNHQGKFSPYLLIFLVSSFAYIVPITVGGLGAREVLFVWGAEFFNLNQ